MKSEISHYSASMVRHLKREAEVSCWCPRPDESKGNFDPEINLFDADALDWSKVNDADVNVYHVGNNWKFHAEIWRASQLSPGIVVLHDARLQNIFIREMVLERKDRSGYLATMSRYYGDEGRAHAEKYLQGLFDIDDLSARYPLTEMAIANSLGVVCHDPALGSWIRSNSPLPVLCTPLASRHPIIQRTRVAAPPYRLLIFGYIGSNRRIEAILKALAEVPGNPKFQLDIFGELYDPPKFQEWVRTSGLQDKVNLHGFVDEETLHAALLNVDLAFNLRFPTMGETSSAQVHLWCYGVTSFVTDIGTYANMPRDSVIHIRPEHEHEDLVRHLRAFFEDPAPYTAIGTNGQQLVKANDGELYSKNLISFCKAILPGRVTQESERVTLSVAGIFAEWGRSHELPAGFYDRAATAIHEIT